MARKLSLSLIVVVAKLAATAVAFWLILRSIDIGAAGRILQNASITGIGLAVSLLIAQVIINALRWRVLARASGIALSPGEAILRFWESLFFGQLTPSGVGGDAWRVYAARKRGATISAAMNSVILDRIIGLAALLIMVFCGFAGELMHDDPVDTVELVIGVGSAAVLAGAVAFVLAGQLLKERDRAWDKWGIAASIRRLSGLLSEVLRRPWLLLATLVLSIVGQVLCAMSVWILAQSVGYDPGLVITLLAVPVALLVSTVPITIAGWGLREGVIAAGLVRAGASPEISAATSLLFGLALALIGLIGGLFLWSGRRSLKQAASEEAAPPWPGAS